MFKIILKYFTSIKDTYFAALRFFQTVWWTTWLRQIFQAVRCHSQLFQWKLICTSNQYCLSYKISNILQFNSSSLFWTLRNCVALSQLFPRCVLHSKDVEIYKDRYIYLLWAIIEGKLLIVYQKNAPLWNKTACSESESRNFDFQWSLVSFLIKHYRFYREARLTCPLNRSTDDNCLGIYVF